MLLKIFYKLYKSKIIDLINDDPDALKQINLEKKSVDINQLIILIITLLAGLSTIIYNIIGIISYTR